MNKNYKYLKYIIDTASGLQKVDGLETSSYFKEASEKYLKEECSTKNKQEVPHPLN